MLVEALIDAIKALIHGNKDLFPLLRGVGKSLLHAFLHFEDSLVDAARERIEVGQSGSNRHRPPRSLDPRLRSRWAARSAPPCRSETAPRVRSATSPKPSCRGRRGGPPQRRPARRCPARERRNRRPARTPRGGGPSARPGNGRPGPRRNTYTANSVPHSEHSNKAKALRDRAGDGTCVRAAFRHPLCYRYRMALTTSHSRVVRGRRRVFGGGIEGAIRSHSASLKSLAWRRLARSYCGRVISVHMLCLAD